MVRMLVADDAVNFVLAVVLERGLAWEVCNCDHPAEPGFGAVLPGRDQTIRPVEGTGHDLDAGPVNAAEGERGAASSTKVALGDGGGAERGRFAAGPGEIALFDLGKGREWRAGCLLAHPAMTDGDLAGRRRQRKANGAALAASGQNGFCGVGHALSTSR